MPHSGGGGSHGGGSHSSGGSHSHSSGGSGGSSRYRTSSSYFPGARTYVYYRNRSPVFVYSNGNLKQASIVRYLLLLFYLPFIFAILSMLITSVHLPKKLHGTEGYDIVIEDNAGILKSTNDLHTKMQEFKDKTGVTPAVITVNNEDWQTYYSSMEQYAYDLYVNRFEDETRFLIVYSEPIVVDDNFNDWHYELMEGDDTYHILTDSCNDIINEKLYKYFTAASKYTTDEAISKTFAELTPNIMRLSVAWETVFIGLGMAAFIAVHMFFMVFFKPKQPYKTKELTEVPGNTDATPRTQPCEYCGGLYVPGIHLKCPHCGASIQRW